MVDYGSGPGLDRYLDLVVGPSGDLVSTSGIAEVEKDLSWRLIGALRYGEGVERPESLQSGAVGRPVEGGLETDVKILVSDIIEDDPRVDSVAAVKVDQQSLDRLRVAARVVLTGGESGLTEFIIEPE
jgi:hypothetical protein